MDFFNAYCDEEDADGLDEDDMEEELWEDLGFDFVDKDYGGVCDACDHGNRTWLLKHGIMCICTCVFCLRKLELNEDTSLAEMRVKIEQFAVELKKRKEEKNKNKNNNIHNIEIAGGAVVPFTPAPPPNKPNPQTNDISSKAPHSHPPHHPTDPIPFKVSRGGITASKAPHIQPHHPTDPIPLKPIGPSSTASKPTKPTPNNDGSLPSPSQPPISSDPMPLKIGDCIKLKKRRTGIIRFIGKFEDIQADVRVMGKPEPDDEIYGIELDTWSVYGNNGYNIFEVKNGKGYFVTRSNISTVINGDGKVEPGFKISSEKALELNKLNPPSNKLDQLINKFKPTPNESSIAPLLAIKLCKYDDEYNKKILNIIHPPPMDSNTNGITHVAFDLPSSNAITSSNNGLNPPEPTAHFRTNIIKHNGEVSCIGGIMVSELSQIQPPYQPLNGTLFNGSGGDDIGLNITQNYTMISPTDPVLFQAKVGDNIVLNKPQNHTVSFQARGGGNITSNAPQNHAPQQSITTACATSPPNTSDALYSRIPKLDYKFPWQRDVEESSAHGPKLNVDPLSFKVGGGDNIESNTPDPITNKAIAPSNNELKPPKPTPNTDGALNFYHPPSIAPNMPSSKAIAPSNNELKPPKPAAHFRTNIIKYKAEMIYIGVIMVIMICVGTYCVVSEDGLLSGALGLPDGDGCGDGLGVTDGDGVGGGELLPGLEDGRLTDDGLSGGGVFNGLIIDGLDVCYGSVGNGTSQSSGGLLPYGAGDGLSSDLVFYELVFYGDGVDDAVPKDRDKDGLVGVVYGVLKERDKNDIGDTISQFNYSVTRHKGGESTICRGDMHMPANAESLAKVIMYGTCAASGEPLAMQKCESDGLDPRDRDKSKASGEPLAELAIKYEICGTESHIYDIAETISPTNGDPLVYNYNYFIRYLCAVVKTLTCAEQVASLDAIASITEAAINARLYQINNNDILYIRYDFNSHGLDFELDKDEYYSLKRDEYYSSRGN